MDDVVPVLASFPAWRRRRASRRARAVVEALLAEAPGRSLIGQAMTKAAPKRAVVPRPNTSPTQAKSAPSKASTPGSVDSGVMVGPDIPDPGLFAVGSRGAVLQQMAQDLADLGDNEDVGRVVGNSRAAINSALNQGAILALLAQGKVVSVYARDLSPAKVFGKRGALLRDSAKLRNALEGIGQVEADRLIGVAAEMGGEVSVVSGSRL